MNNADVDIDVPYLDTALARCSLDAEMTPYGIEPARAVDYVRRALRGLELCHRSRLIHRDIKPGNLFLSIGGDAVLGDFGIAAMMDSNGLAEPGGDMRIRAPELHAGSRSTSRTDVYSMAVTLYALLAGRMPFSQPYEADLVAALHAGSYPHLRDIAPHVGRALADKVRKGMALVPQNRYASAAEFDNALAIPVDVRSLVRRRPREANSVRGRLSAGGVDIRVSLRQSTRTKQYKPGSSRFGQRFRCTGAAHRRLRCIWRMTAHAGTHWSIPRLYLPKSWIADADRRARAGVPDDVEFATKPELAQQMITDALDAGVCASWVSGDEVYGADSGLRATCRDRGIGYVLPIARNHHVVTAKCRVEQLAAAMPSFGWQKLSAGPGSKGPRLYSWLLIDIASALPGHEWIMLRRNDSTGELAYYRCWSPQPVPLRTLVGGLGGGAGQLRSPSRRPRAKQDSTNIRYVPGRPGIDG